MTGWKTKKLQVFAEQFRRLILTAQPHSTLKLIIVCIQILIHPQYSVGGNLHFDVCLLKLDKPISFPDHPNVGVLNGPPI